MTTLTLLLLIACAASYVIGSLPFGLWVGLLWKGVDVRTLGSNNIGATNVLRVLGPGPAAVSFVLDVLKGVVGIALAHYLWQLPAFHATGGGPLPLPLLMPIGLCAIFGHTLSPFLGFRGGKGVATSLGVLLALHWPIALVALVAWILVLAVSRYVSAASLIATYTLPFTARFTLRGIDAECMFWLGIVLAVLVTVKHRGNIARLLAGTESRFGQRVEATGETTAEVR